MRRAIVSAAALRVRPATVAAVTAASNFGTLTKVNGTSATSSSKADASTAKSTTSATATSSSSSSSSGKHWSPKEANEFGFASEYADVKDQLTPTALKVLKETLEKFQGRQNQLIERRLTPDYFRKYSAGTVKLEDVRGERRPFDAKSVPKDLHQRQVELTGPVADPAMAINALNSKAKGVQCFMGDAEDASTLSLQNTIGTLKTNAGIARRNLTAEKTGADGTSKKYELNTDKMATYIFRAPGLHLPLPSVTFRGQPISAFIFHSVMYAVNNGAELMKNGSGPYMYVPKLEGADEASFVEDVLASIEDQLKWSRGTIKVTVLIETWPTIIELPRVVEALLASKRIVGINAARWDYLASLHKHFGRDLTMPPRKQLTMQQPFMVAYVKRIVEVAHHYGIHGIGGMSAFIPAKDAEQNRLAMDNARKDKQAERAAGLDGCWIAHPGMADIRSVFDGVEHQINSTKPDVAKKVTVQDLSPLKEAVKITEADVEFNIEISIEYLAAWMTGRGAVALHNLMEDAATMEISRYNLWNHVHKKVKLSDSGETVTLELIRKLADKVVKRLQSGKTQVPYASEFFEQAKAIVLDAVESDAPPTFLTLPALQQVHEQESGSKLAFDMRNAAL